MWQYVQSFSHEMIGVSFIKAAKNQLKTFNLVLDNTVNCPAMPFWTYRVMSYLAIIPVMEYNVIEKCHLITHFTTEHANSWNKLGVS